MDRLWTSVVNTGEHIFEVCYAIIQSTQICATCATAQLWLGGNGH